MSPRTGRAVAATFFVVVALLLVQRLPGSNGSAAGDRVTILYDAFGKPSMMTQDWGYSALVEYGGKRILFDIGNNPTIFARNVKAAGVDLQRLDLVVLSHRHLDHTASQSRPRAAAANRGPVRVPRWSWWRLRGKWWHAGQGHARHRARAGASRARLRGRRGMSRRSPGPEGRRLRLWTGP